MKRKPLDVLSLSAILLVSNRRGNRQFERGDSAGSQKRRPLLPLPSRSNRLRPRSNRRRPLQRRQPKS